MPCKSQLHDTEKKKKKATFRNFIFNYDSITKIVRIELTIKRNIYEKRKITV